MTTLGLELAVLEIIRGGRLGLTDSRRRLEGNAEVNMSAVGDTALDTTGVVGAGGETLLGGGLGSQARLHFGGSEGVIVDGAGHLAASETRANLEPLSGGDTEHSVCQLGLELVEARLAQTNGHVADHASHRTTDAVVLVPVLLNHTGHPSSSVFIGAAGWGERVDGLAIDFGQQVQELGVRRGRGVFGSRGNQVLVTHRRHKRHDLNVVGEVQVLFRNGTGSDSACGFVLVSPTKSPSQIQYTEKTHQLSHEHCYDHHRCWPSLHTCPSTSSPRG